MHRVAAALLLVLAGCASVVSPGPDTTTATVTPVAIPADPVRTPSGFPPGVTADGVTDAVALARAHDAALAGTSFTVTRLEVRRDADGTLRQRYARTVQRGDDPARFYYRFDATDRDTRPVNRTDERWSDGTRAFSAVTREGERTVSERFVGPLPENATSAQGIYRLFVLLDTRLAGEEVRDGTRIYRVVAGPGASVPPSISELSFEALVDERGLVRAYDLSYVIEREDGPLRVEVSVRFSDVGSTAVPTPEWVPDESATPE